MTAAALLSTAAFLLTKWAFMNYYFIPVWLLVLAVAGRGIPFEAADDDIALPWLLPRLHPSRHAVAA
jgi:hypothetical protein